MGDTKLTFRRYEKKYMLTPEKYRSIMARICDYIEPDEYPRSTVCSIYYDGWDYHLIRHSIDRPVYKEKLRLRSYGVPGENDPVFLELKKKYKGVVYKRRAVMPAAEAEAYLAGKAAPDRSGQVINEIDWFLKENRPSPKVLIACDRSSYRGREDKELRITFDENIRWRREELSLTAGSHGEPLVEDGGILMEIKIPGAAPIWLARVLSELEIFPASFSKYGTCYTKNILREQVEGLVFDV